MAYSQYATRSGNTIIYHGSGSSTSTNAAAEGRAAVAQYRGGGGGSGSLGGSAQIINTVSVKPVGNGAEVTIDGVSFSVAGGQVEKFLSDKGFSGSNYQSNVNQAKQLDTNYNKSLNSNVAKGLLLTGLERKQNPQNAIKLLNANVSGMNNQGVNNNYLLKSRVTIRQSFDKKAETVVNDIARQEEKNIKVITNKNGDVIGYNYNNQSISSIESLNKVFSNNVGRIFQNKFEEGYAKISKKNEETLNNLDRMTKVERLEYIKLGQKRRNNEENIRFKQLVKKAATETKSTNLRIIGAISNRGINTIYGSVALVNSLRKQPVKTIKALPKNVLEGFKQDWSTLKTDPLVGVAQLGTDILLFKGVGKAASGLKAGTISKITKISPKYVGVAEIGKTLKVNVGGKIVNLKVVGKIPKEKLASQVKKAGTEVTAISSQSDSLLRLIKRNKTISKPIPRESSFNMATKVLLKKFDSGKITSLEVYKLNKLIKQQGAKGLLERSFFVDPTGKIRPSRLGVLPENQGSIIDYFKQGITFRRAKPQILLFDRIKVESFPNNLKYISNKISRNKVLSKIEADALLNFQLKKSGKFKPVGFVTGESELTLAPGEIIKRNRVVGRTIINGRTIPIIQAEVIKPTGRLAQLLRKNYLSKNTMSETRELVKRLKKETGLKYTTSSLKRDTAKYFSLKKAGLSSIVYASKRYNTSPKISLSKYVKSMNIKYNYIGKPSSKSNGNIQSKYYYKGSTSKLPAKYSSRVNSMYKPTIYNKKYNIAVAPIKDTNKKNLNIVKSILGNKLAPSYRIVIGSGKKVKTLGGRYTPQEAISKGAYTIDRTKERTVRIIPTKQAPNARFKMNYLVKARQKFRNYRISGGQKVKYSATRLIEKRKYFNDLERLHKIRR